jgi:hypothetical protein
MTAWVVCAPYSPSTVTRCPLHRASAVCSTRMASSSPLPSRMAQLAESSDPISDVFPGTWAFPEAVSTTTTPSQVDGSPPKSKSPSAPAPSSAPQLESANARAARPNTTSTAIPDREAKAAPRCWIRLAGTYLSGDAENVT